VRTNVTLALADQNPALAAAHDELYPERVDERIPLSLTLLYPWVPVDSLTDAHLVELRAFFAGQSPFEFELVRVAEFTGQVVYAVPEPDDELRSTMRALWAAFPDYPPYGTPGNDPPPHCTLARLDVPPPRSLAGVAERVRDLLPARFTAREATLMAEHAPDRWEIRDTFPFAAPPPNRA
jgi:2'-5' RNA ligase superfamily